MLEFLNFTAIHKTMTLPTTQYVSLLKEKEHKLTQLLAPFAPPPLEVFASQVRHFRMRAEFRLWHDGEDLFHVMFDKATHQRKIIHQFEQGSELINQMMTAIIPLLKQEEVLRYRLFQIDYLTTLSGKIIVSLLYHKPLTQNWQHCAERLKEQLQQRGFDLHLIGRANKQKICLSQDYIDEILQINGQKYLYRQVENCFTQPNTKMNQKMLAWAIDCTRGSEKDLLELYCGNGNFSLALAQNFRRVLATEVAKPSVEAAQFNLQANGIKNVQIIRMSAEDFTQALQGVRPFYRLRHIDLSAYQCQTILVDPPRAGLDEKTLNLVANYERILYISCNPHSLYKNLHTLTQTHRIERIALFDQFPYTEHMEVGVWLIKK